MLTWEELQKEKHSYNKIWDKLKAEFSGDIRKFLDKSYLVVTYEHGQVSFGLTEPYSIALEAPAFFISNDSSRKLFNLMKELNALSEYNPRGKTLIRKELEKFSTKGLQVKHFCAEVRFPSLKYEYIQEIKHSSYCDQEAMDMSTVSINVILKKEKDLPKE